MTGVVRLVPMLMVMGTIFFLSHQPASSLSLDLFAGADKLAHGLAYASLAAAMIYAFTPQPNWNRVWLVTACCLAYGLTDELHQSFIPGRVVSIADLLADAGGALLLAAAWLWLARHRLKKEQGNRTAADSLEAS